MTLDEYLTFLGATIADHLGNGGGLQSRASSVNAGPGLRPARGRRLRRAWRRRGQRGGGGLAGAAQFKALTDTPEDPAAYVLRHVPKVWQSIRLGPLGPVPRPSLEREGEIGSLEIANGYAYVHDHRTALARTGSNSEALMSIAGDVGALLCLGAVPHLAGRDGERIFQVFRNWSLDRRRVNEWRDAGRWTGLERENGSRPL